MTKQEYLAAIEPHYSGYQELHIHTEASFRDAVNKVDEIVDKTMELGRNAFAITDHGNQMRLFHGFKARTAKEKEALEQELRARNVDEGEIKAALKTFSPTDSMRCPTEKMWEYVMKYPDAFIAAVKRSPQYVPGIELYFQPEKEFNKERYHIILYAKDWEGQKALFKIENLAQLNPGNTSDRMKPVRTTWADLERLCGPGTSGHGHIIGTSACVAGYIPQLLLQPWIIAEKQAEIHNQMRYECELFSVEDLKTASASYEQAVQIEKDAKEVLKWAKKAGKTDYEKKIARQRKKVEKLELARDAAQTSLWGSNSEADEAADAYTAEKKILNELMEESERAKDVPANMPSYVRQVEKAKKAVEATKDYLVTVKKALQPLEKLTQKVEELEEQKSQLGDTFAQAKEAALHFERIFGKGNFYIELQKHDIPKEEVVYPMLCQLIDATGIPPTVANDVHFCNPEDKHKRDMIAAMRFNQPVRESCDLPGKAELYFKSNEQMAALRDDRYWKVGMENTSRIAESCNVYYKKAMHLPEFDAKSAGYETPKAYLEAYCRNRIPDKYPLNTMNDEQRDSLLKTIDERLTYELNIIEGMGFSSYIAIVQDFIFYGRQTGGNMAIGPGRGSAAGSIVCYLADITDIDPLRFDLLFERFLNPDRVSMPEHNWAFSVNPITQGCAA